jgi:hypothetical protein
LSRLPAARTLRPMLRDFFGLSPEDLAARIRTIATTAAGAPVAHVHVGAEVHGYRNVGVDLPPERRSVEKTRALRRRAREALESAGVPMAANALAPKVAGDLRGSVHVRDVVRSEIDASHFMGPARRG